MSNALAELMIPSVSPFEPMTRTSLRSISSLSRFSLSLSFALIVQHLQAKKITVQRQQSPHGSHSAPRTVNKGRYQPTAQPVCRWERRALLCFARRLYHIFLPLSSPFLNFSQKYFFAFSSFWYDMNVHRKNSQKSGDFFLENSTPYAFSQKYLPIFVTNGYLQTPPFAV